MKTQAHKIICIISENLVKAEMVLYMYHCPSNFLFFCLCLCVICIKIYFCDDWLPAMGYRKDIIHTNPLHPSMKLHEINGL